MEQLNLSEGAAFLKLHEMLCRVFSEIPSSMIFVLVIFRSNCTLNRDRASSFNTKLKFAQSPFL